MCDRLERRQWINYNSLYLVPEDIIEIGHALRREFPDLMFRPIDREKPYEVTGGQYRVIDGKVVYDGGGEPLRFIPKPRSEWKIELTPDPAALLRSYESFGWVLPHGWKPAWEVSEDGRPFVANPPDLAFAFNRPLFRSSRTGLTSQSAPQIESDTECIELRDGSFGGAFWPWEEETGRFLRRCKTIFRRHTTVRCVVVDDEGHILYTSDKETARDGRKGFHALEWTRAHLRHFIDNSIKPIDWTPPSTPCRLRFNRRHLDDVPIIVVQPSALKK